ncbi:MAG TPA: amidohydrolase family protein [Candidatus Sulfotelmatobacter sp.]|jgi:imidazolonepropionase-like amidohydrolase|nr:amidohydrolase family protein [Candidatus Sulfotelmatobacter sp.]
MKRLLLGALLAISPFSFAQAPQPTVFSIVNVTVIDVAEGRARPFRNVIVRDGKIEENRDTLIKGKLPGVRINGTGKFLIPGLWDMHVHTIFGDWFPKAKEVTLPLFIANGITGVRDMGSELETLQQWRKEISAGTLIGPRMVMSGPMLDGPQPRFPSSIAIKTPEDGRRAVNDLKKRGADFIKLQSLIPRDAVFAIADEAKKQGITFVGHVPDSVRASEASNAGQKSFEHLIGIFEGASPLEDEFIKGQKSESKFLSTYDPARAAKLFELLAKNQTWQCPTLVWERGGNLIELTDYHDPRAKYVPASWKNGTWKRFTDEIMHDFNTDDPTTRRKFVAKELEVVNAMHKAGVPFLAGTDTPPGVYIFPGFSLHEELQRFAAAGFSPLEALRTATLNPAKFLGREDELGTIEKGKLADMVLLDANPLDDIRNTQRIAAVIANGHYFSRADLDKMLAGVEAAAKAE